MSEFVLTFLKAFFFLLTLYAQRMVVQKCKFPLFSFVFSLHSFLIAFIDFSSSVCIFNLNVFCFVIRLMKCCINKGHIRVCLLIYFVVFFLVLIHCLFFSILICQGCCFVCLFFKSLLKHLPLFLYLPKSLFHFSFQKRLN